MLLGAGTQVFYVCNSAPMEGHHLSLGVIDADMLGKYLNTEPGADVLTVRCGPPAFLADTKATLEETGHGASTQVRRLALGWRHPVGVGLGFGVRVLGFAVRRIRTGSGFNMLSVRCGPADLLANMKGRAGG